MFLLKVWIGLTTFKIMLEVVVFHLQGNGILRVYDTLDVIIIICSFLMRE